jgi:hypothetical protein
MKYSVKNFFTWKEVGMIIGGMRWERKNVFKNSLTGESKEGRT